MQAPPIVALGQKDKVTPTLGQRIRAHFYNNRGTYSAIGAGALAGAAGHYFGHKTGQVIERNRRLTRQINAGLMGLPMR